MRSCNWRQKAKVNNHSKKKKNKHPKAKKSSLSFCLFVLFCFRRKREIQLECFENELVYICHSIRDTSKTV